MEDNREFVRETGSMIAYLLSKVLNLADRVAVLEARSDALREMAEALAEERAKNERGERE